MSSNTERCGKSSSAPGNNDATSHTTRKSVLPSCKWAPRLNMHTSMLITVHARATWILSTIAHCQPPLNCPQLPNQDVYAHCRSPCCADTRHSTACNPRHHMQSTNTLNLCTQHNTSRHRTPHTHTTHSTFHHTKHNHLLTINSLSQPTPIKGGSMTAHTTFLHFYAFTGYFLGEINPMIQIA